MKFTLVKESIYETGETLLKTSYQARPGTANLVAEFTEFDKVKPWDILVRGSEISLKGTLVANETNPDNRREIVHLILFSSPLKTVNVTLNISGQNEYSITNDS